MSLADLTPEAVREAIAEFDVIERDMFLKTYGFRPARGYMLVHEGKPYDSKAIAGVAHKYTTAGYPLSAKDFSGGERAAVHRLRELGFVVEGLKNQHRSLPTFEIGGVYHRARDIHDVHGGQERGGICTPKNAPLIFLFAGESGGQYGYKDGYRDDGIFAYTGEGQVGDMAFTKGNRAIRDHVSDGRDLMLFEKLPRSGYYRFLGFFACDGFEFGGGQDREGGNRQTIIFHLRPALTTEEPELLELTERLLEKTLEELRLLAIAGAQESPARREGRRSYIERSARVRAYVLKRAKGICESCEKPAPFLRSTGEPYLEPHHTRRLADGGPDHPRWVGAVCPNCHCEIHHGADATIRNKGLEVTLARIEKSNFR